MAKFVITKRANEELQFSLKAGNGQEILASEGYSAKAGCLNGIESVRKNSQIAERFEEKVSKNGKFYFNLKSSNGQIVGTSEMYESKTAQENGIASVMKNAPEATIDDQTL